MNGEIYMSECSDSELVRMVLDKNNDAYDELMHRWANAVMYSAYSIVRDEYTAEDIAQEAFFVCWIKLHMLREAEKFGAWVCRVAKNQALKAVTNKISCYSLDTVNNISSKGSSPENILVKKETKAQINEAFQNLPEKAKETAELYYIAGLSQKQIASQLEIPEGTVKRRLFDAREKLKSELEKSGVIVNRTPMQNEERGIVMTQKLINEVREKIDALKERLEQNWWEFGEDYIQLLSDAEKAVYSMGESDEKQDSLIKLYYYQTFTDTSDEAYEKAIDAACERKDAETFLSLVRNADEHGQSITSKIQDNLQHFESADNFGNMMFWYARLLLNNKNYDEAKKMFRKTMDIFNETDCSLYAASAAAIKFMEFDEKYNVTDGHYDNFHTGVDGISIWNNNGTITLRDQPGWSSVCTYSSDEKELLLTRTYHADVLMSVNVNYKEYFRTGMKIGDTITSADGECTLEMISDSDTVSVKAGTFTGCCKFIKKDKEMTSEIWYCPNVGLVKAVFNETDITEAYELSEYNIAGGEGLLPFEIGNRWNYIMSNAPEALIHHIEYEVVKICGDITLLTDLRVVKLKK